MERLPVNGGELEFETKGTGEPLVLIHGGITGEAFDCLLGQPALTDRYQVTHYHRRGFLGSTHHTGPFSIAQQAQDALAVVQRVALGRAHVAGHSYGGATALQLALGAPDAVHSLALLEPPLAVASAESFFARMAPSGQAYESGDGAGAVREFLNVVLGENYDVAIGANLPDGWFERAVADIDTLFQVELPALNQWQFTEDLARRISQPVLSVVGANSDPFFVEGHALLQAWLPQAEAFVLSGATHGLQYMNPTGMAEALAAFLARHPMPSTV